MLCGAPTRGSSFAHVSFVCSGREEADARMESWKYDPWVLAENAVADPCSLYLSLRNSGDERVQKEIGFLIERLPH